MVACKRDLEVLENRKRLNLKQNAGVKWVIEGDENSSLFHGWLINCHMNGKKIYGLKFEGKWTNKQV